ncbi:MAG: DUF5615 family PIN-like protein [Armatimonadetes bacterium]|nr:DUF5615 family PIN-like protein [Armatimonadota bacterium]
MAAGFLLDMGVSPKVAAVLAKRGLTAVHIQDIGLSTASDKAILEEARRRDMVVITTDKDLAGHVAVDRATSPSVVTLRLDKPAAEGQIAALEGLLDVLPPGGLDACLITLEPGRYRRRPLVPDGA